MNDTTAQARATITSALEESIKERAARLEAELTAANEQITDLIAIVAQQTLVTAPTGEKLRRPALSMFATMKEYNAALREYNASAAPVAVPQRPTDDELWDTTLRDRDTYHEWADKLAGAIAIHFGAEIGEHSNMNCPWAEALDAIETANPVSLAGALPDQSICNDARFIGALDRYMDAVTADDRNTDRRVKKRLAIFAAADAWHSAAPLPLPAGPSEPYLWIDISPNSPDRTSVPMFEDIEQVTIIGSTRKFGYCTTPLFLAAAPATPPAAPEVQDAAHDVLAERQRQLDREGWTAAGDVLAERRRQVEQEGYDSAHDDAHPNGEIAAYAAFYAMPPAARDWPATETGYGATFREAIVPADWNVPTTGDRRRELVKAGALILAEIERIHRADANSYEAGVLRAVTKQIENGEHIGWVLSDGSTRYYRDPTDADALRAAGVARPTSNGAAGRKGGAE